MTTVLQTLIDGIYHLKDEKVPPKLSSDLCTNKLNAGYTMHCQIEFIMLPNRSVWCCRSCLALLPWR